MNIKTEPKLLSRTLATVIDYGLYLAFYIWLIVTYGTPNDEGGYSLNDIRGLWIFAVWFVLAKADTVRLYSIKSDLMEIWEDWDRILSKRIKKWGHKQKYPPLTNEETEKLEAVKIHLMNDYSLINDIESIKTN